MQVASNILILFGVLLLSGFSFSVIYRPSKFFHIAHAITLTFGAYFTFLFTIQVNLMLALAIPIAILGATLLLVLLELTIYRPLRNMELASWQLLVASLGAYVVLQNLVSIVWGDQVRSFRTWPVKVGHEILGAYITDVQIITIGVSISLLVLSWLFLERTTLGKEIKAVSDNPELSQLFGISTNRAILWSFGVGSALAACAGILIALDTDMTPTMGFNWLLYGVVAMIIGGMGKMRHLILGALLLASAQHLAAYYLDSKWMNATAFIILILFLAWRPYGFSGKKLKKAKI